MTTSNRHLGRVIAVQTLYEQELRSLAGDTSFDIDEVLARNLDRYANFPKDDSFIKNIVFGVIENKADLDERLQPLAAERPISQISAMDRVVLRLSLFEFDHASDDLPHKVIINEAVELAKTFGGDNSPKFINGVLGTLLRQKEEANAAITIKKSVKKDKHTDKDVSKD